MASSETQTLQFVSWNVHGVTTKISSQPKLFFIIEELTRQGAEVVFLQETHIGSDNYKTLDGVEGWKCFSTVYDTKSKGVAILIKDDVPFQYICHDEDYSGGYLVLFCYLHDELFTLVNVYNHKNDKDVLNRLQEYLRETAEGMLVVGGDFNTVLDLTFDRKSQTDKHIHTPLRDMFEKFTTSLNLIDTWAHLHPTKKDFTRFQNDSFSRLDMFLMPEDIIERVSNVTICKAKRITTDVGSTKMENISDHNLVVLSLILDKFSKKSKKKPKVASKLNENIYSRNERVGKINGAEILSVINSLTDSQQVYPGGISIQKYKTDRCELTEIAKKDFNEWLYNKQIPDYIKLSYPITATRRIFCVCYLIFTMILAKRLRILLEPHNKKQQPNTDCYIVTLVNLVRIRQTFLKKILSYLCKIWKDTKKHKKKTQGDFVILEALGLTEDLGILDNILPKVTLEDNSSTDGGYIADDENDITDDNKSTRNYIKLQEGCPLTRSIHSLVLKYLAICIERKRYTTHICYERQLVVIHSIASGPQENPAHLKVFKKFSKNGTKLKILKMDKS